MEKGKQNKIKLFKLNPRSKEKPKSEWIVNMSGHPLSTAEPQYLTKDLKYNINDVYQLELFANLEAELKTTGLATEI